MGGPAQYCGSSDHISFGQGFPDPSGGTAAVGIAVVVDRKASRAVFVDNLHPETELITQLLHGDYVAGIAGTEAEVVPDNEVCGVKSVEKDLTDKLQRGHRSEVQGVLHHQDSIHAGIAEGLKFVLKPPHDELRSRIGPVDLGGVGIKRHGNRGNVVPLCLVGQLRQNVLVATMDAVKVPDGNDSRSEVLGGDFGGIVPDVTINLAFLLQMFVPPGNLPAPEHSKVTR